MTVSGDRIDASHTRDRLLYAAGEVFAEHGFHRATVREICHRAGANIAAVNYHFGDKQRLYEAAVEEYLRAAMEKHPPLGGVEPNAPPEDQFRAFVRSFLFRILEEGRPSWHGRLILREMVEPTSLLDRKIDQMIRPLILLLMSIIRPLLPSDAGELTVRRAALSVIAQIVFYNHGRPVLERLFGQRGYTTEQIEDLSRHICEFSLSALHCMGDRGKA